jgi:hypothetical protein
MTAAVEDPAQILIGLTATGAGTAAMQADWRAGTQRVDGRKFVATHESGSGL